MNILINKMCVGMIAALLKPFDLSVGFPKGRDRLCGY
jgi:hypothetical protein